VEDQRDDQKDQEQKEEELGYPRCRTRNDCEYDNACHDRYDQER